MQQRCAARRKNGVPCGNWPVKGADKCRMHLGKRASAVKLQREASTALARLDLPPVEDPLTQLAAVTAQVIGWKDQLAVKVNDLTSLRYEGEGSGEQLRAEVALWERALDRCEKFLTAMARLDIDNRLAKITEARATAIIVVFVAALEAAGIEGEQREAVLAAADAEFARQGALMVA